MKYFRTGGYSTAFTPRGEGQRYLLDRIPEDAWAEIRALAKAERISLRALILQLLTQWATRTAKARSRLTRPGQHAHTEANSSTARAKSAGRR